jgi:hypothetical protein
MLVFVVFCLNRSSNCSTDRNSTANADNRVEILHKFAKKVIVNNIKGVIAGDNELN